jgi:hypothetical protein
VNNEQPSPSNERFSLISLVNVDDFHSKPLKNANSDRRIAQNNLIIIIIRKGFNVSSSGKNSI